MLSRRLRRELADAKERQALIGVRGKGNRLYEKSRADEMRG